MTSSTTTGPATAGNRTLLRFGGTALLLYLAWFFGYEQYLAPDGRLDIGLCANIGRSSAAVLRGLGFAASYQQLDFSTVLMAGRPAVRIGAACNGAVLYALFAGFVLAFPGSWQRKLWYVPLGCALIWLLNVLRVAALALNNYYAPASLDFNHHYTFTFVVYACIFGLWMLWAKRLAGPTLAGLTTARG